MCVGGCLCRVAQGAYFSLCAKHYSQAVGVTETEATATLGSYFATCYLLCEVLFKFVGGYIKESPRGGTTAMYVMFSLVGVASAFLMWFIEDPTKFGDGTDTDTDANTQEHTHDKGSPNQAKKVNSNSNSSAQSNSTGACSLLVQKPKMLLLLPTQFTFGFGSVIHKCTYVIV